MVHRQEPVLARPGHAPTRTCVGCRVRGLTGELLRVVLSDGELVLDRRRRLPGRGAWIHPDLDCLTKAERRRAFGRALKVQQVLDVGGIRAELENPDSRCGTAGDLPRPPEKDRKQVDPS